MIRNSGIAGDDAGGEDAQDHLAVMQRPSQAPVIVILQTQECRFVPAIDRAMAFPRFILQHPGAQHRGQGDRDQAGNDDRHDDGDGEFVQQPPDDAAHEQDGDEHRRQ